VYQTIPAICPRIAQCPKRAERKVHPALLEIFGFVDLLPANDSIDAKRERHLTGCRHRLGIVPALSELVERQHIASAAIMARTGLLPQVAQTSIRSAIDFGACNVIVSLPN
jgi:hypothetical protein